MITTGSKLLIGSALAAALFAVVYGVTQGGALGTIGLASAAAGLALLAGISAHGRDANVSAMDHASFASSAAAQATARPSLWPLVIGVGATSATLGLVTTPAFFVIGCLLLVVGGLEWLVQVWSERASADADYNAHARDVLIHPLELPLAAAATFGVIAYSFSRIMLGMPSKSATVIAFSVVAALVIGVAALLAVKRGATKTALTGTFGLATIALVAGGTIAGLSGERETHPHVTTGDMAASDECGAEEGEADEHASQTVAGKSNMAAEVAFDGSALTFEVPGFVPGLDDQGPLTLPRSNPNNVAFRNMSDDAARLLIEMHPRLDDDGQPTGPERICTALVAPGGVQFLTLIFDQPSFAIEDGYAFTVPDTDAALGVVVP